MHLSECVAMCGGFAHKIHTGGGTFVLPGDIARRIRLRISLQNKLLKTGEKKYGSIAAVRYAVTNGNCSMLEFSRSLDHLDDKASKKVM